MSRACKLIAQKKPQHAAGIQIGIGNQDGRWLAIIRTYECKYKDITPLAELSIRNVLFVQCGIWSMYLRARWWNLIGRKP